MAEENTQEQGDRTQGDAMLVATSMLKPPKARTAMKVLPRTIAWENLFIIVACALIGLLIGLRVFGVDNLQAVLSTVVVTGALGFILPSLSPLEGESILTWFGLQAKSTTARRVNINGRRVKMYIGTYPLKRAALGATRITPAGGNVKAYAYDERGYPQMTTTKANAQLEEQRRLRTNKSQQQLRPSTRLESPSPGRRSLVKGRKEQQAKAAPRLPQAGEKRKSRVELNKKIKLKKPKRAKKQKH